MSKQKQGDTEICPGVDLSSEWFETILCSLNDGVFCVDENWKVTCFNKAAAAITGVQREKAIGMQCCDVFRTDICKGACALRFTMETGKPLVNLMIFITDSKGEKKPVSISTALLKDKQGKIVGGVETFRDLSLVEQLRSLLETPASFDDIISKSPKMGRIFDMIPAIAESDSTVLITGESGTGKDLLAKAIHKTSSRRDGPLVTINCAALPETLLESELFGYKAGAFTNAARDKPGRFSLAQGGTIFLDEIGDLPVSIQVKLLKVLQDKIFSPLGGVEEIRADVRIVSATNRILEDLVKEGRFRTDLYYRIKVISLDLPPLRERSEDIPLLIDHFISRFATIKNKDISGVSPKVLQILLNHLYPGNIRELENIVEHAFVLCPGGVITEKHLPESMQRKDTSVPDEGLKPMDQYEAELILTALRENQWNRTKAAKELGIHKTTLFRKIQKLGISLPNRDGRSRE